MGRRFHRIFEPVESVEQYRPGGYHPVHLDEILNNRYRIVGKLGYGKYSTVWLATDLHSPLESAVDIAANWQRHRRHRQVAIKIVRADASNNNRELEFLRHISDSNSSHPGKAFVINLLDHFQQNGPNGRHLCLVLPVMLSDCHEITVRRIKRNAAYMKKISRSIVLGMDYIHASGIIHTDLQPANVLLSLAASSESEFPLMSPEFSPVEWLHEEDKDDSAPKYLLSSQRARGALDEALESSLIIKIGDLGGAIWKSELDRRNPVTPIALRPPELIRGEKWNASIDIWSLGCLLFQLATAEPLFALDTFGCSAICIAEQHQSMICELFDTNIHGHDLFTTYLKCRLSPDFGEDEIPLFTAFLRSMLQRDVSQRICSTQLVRHPWLQIEDDSGSQRNEKVG